MRVLYYFQQVILYAPQPSARLSYMAHWLGQRLIGRPLLLIHDMAQWPAGVAGINYSCQPLPFASYQIQPQGLLHQKGFTPLWPQVADSAGIPAIFPMQEGDHPFDLPAAAFYLLSRYEEYDLHAKKDSYGRFCHTGSLLHRQGWLKRPIADEWMLQLKNRLAAFFPEEKWIEQPGKLLHSFDLDIAWSYKHKGWQRTLGGWAKDMLRARIGKVLERGQVLLGRKQDPFDRFAALQALLSQQQHPAVFFALVAEEAKGYDKNISPHHPAMQQLLRQLQQFAGVELHASWAASGNVKILEAEKILLEQILQQPVTTNRMHYLNFSLPDTYEQLLQAGITHDYSMGYAEVNGFRAGTSHPFLWYHLLKEEMTELQISPFAWMDANSRFEQKDSPDLAWRELLLLQKQVMETGGEFISIWHPHIVANDTEGNAWWQLLKQYLAMPVI